MIISVHRSDHDYTSTRSFLVHLSSKKVKLSSKYGLQVLLNFKVRRGLRGVFKIIPFRPTLKHQMIENSKYWLNKNTCMWVTIPCLIKWTEQLFPMCWWDTFNSELRVLFLRRHHQDAGLAIKQVHQHWTCRWTVRPLPNVTPSHFLCTSHKWSIFLPCVLRGLRQLEFHPLFQLWSRGKPLESSSAD